jgi:hypothetical protein
MSSISDAKGLNRLADFDLTLEGGAFGASGKETAGSVGVGESAISTSLRTVTDT